MVSEMATGEQVSRTSVGLPERQERSQIFDNRDGAGCQFAFGCRFPDVNRGANSASDCVDIFGQHRASFGNSSGRVEANPKQGSISI
jgi:hypothetical protein